jgi:5'-3' exonuclease
MINEIMNKYLVEDDQDTLKILLRQKKEVRMHQKRALEDTKDPQQKDRIRERVRREIESLDKRIEAVRERISNKPQKRGV